MVPDRYIERMLGRGWRRYPVHASMHEGEQHPVRHDADGRRLVHMPLQQDSGDTDASRNSHAERLSRCRRVHTCDVAMIAVHRNQVIVGSSGMMAAGSLKLALFILGETG